MTHRKIERKGPKRDRSLNTNNEETITPDLSLLSISRDGINPIVTVNNFIKEHMPTNKSSDRSDFSRFKHGTLSQSDIKPNDGVNYSKLSNQEMESIDEVSSQVDG